MGFWLGLIIGGMALPIYLFLGADQAWETIESIVGSILNR